MGDLEQGELGEALPIAIGHALRAGNLPGPPFDRMLIAQALAEGLSL